MAYTNYLIVNKSNLFLLIPELFFFGLIIFVLLLSLFFSLSKTYNYPLILPSLINFSIVGMFLTVILYLNNFKDNFLLLNNCLQVNYTLNHFKIIILIFTIFFLFSINQYIIRNRINDFEILLLLLIATFCNLILISAFDFLIVFTLLEIQSLCYYCLVASSKKTLLGTEAGLKYFIIGSVSAIFILFGLLNIYFVSGTLNFYDLILFNLAPINDKVLSFIFKFGIILIFFGLFFKLLIVPFHFWAVEVYDGAPTIVTFYLLLVPKFTYFVIMLKLYYFVFRIYIIELQICFIFLAFLSILVGSFVGFRQIKLKKLLIFSSINHIGFVFLAFSLGSLESLTVCFSYLVVYMLISLNIWNFFLIFTNNTSKNKNLIYISDLKYLLRGNKPLTYIFVLNLVFLSGMPPFIGFFIKFLLLSLAVDLYLYFLITLILFINVLASYYYFNIIKTLVYDNDLLKARRGYYNKYLRCINRRSLYVILLNSLFIIYLSFNPELVTNYIYKLISVIMF